MNVAQKRFKFVEPPPIVPKDEQDEEEKVKKQNGHRPNNE